MTSQERRRLMRVLQQAKTGDELACERLVAEIASQYSYMVRGYHSVDPAFDGDDVMDYFRVGIWEHIARVDGRGDPLFHLAWRGQRAVCHQLRVIKERRYGTEAWVRDYGAERSIGTLPEPEQWEPMSTREDADPEYVLQITERRDAARKHIVEVLARVSLTKRHRQVVDWALTDPDPEELGANKRLAQHLGTSEQFASVQRRQALALLEQELSADGAGV